MAKESKHFASGGAGANVGGGGGGAWGYPVPGSHSYRGTAWNVVWQDTSSNATYCSAASALTHST